MDDVGTDRWLTPGVRGIGGASLLADLGHEIPTSLLPSFLTSTLGAPAAALGLIEGAADAVAGAARFGGGVLSDDPERRRSGHYVAMLSDSSQRGSRRWRKGTRSLAGLRAFLIYPSELADPSMRISYKSDGNSESLDVSSAPLILRRPTE